MSQIEIQAKKHVLEVHAEYSYGSQTGTTSYSSRSYIRD